MQHYYIKVINAELTFFLVKNSVLTRIVVMEFGLLEFCCSLSVKLALLLLLECWS